MKIVRHFAPVVVALLAATAACSSSTASTGPQDPGATGDGDTSAAAAPDKNPDGVPYPTNNIGTSARNGATPGSTMQNFKFLGYPDGDLTKGLQPMSLASFFDPKATKYRMIHLQASGSWCIHCQKETQTVATLKAQLDMRQVAWIITLAEGRVVGQASTAADLKNWITAFEAPFTHFLDPGNRNLGIFYDDAALPWNATLDARTMEIIDSNVGGLEDSKTLLDNVDGLLAQLK